MRRPSTRFLHPQPPRTLPLLLPPMCLRRRPCEALPEIAGEALPETASEALPETASDAVEWKVAVRVWTTWVMDLVVMHWLINRPPTQTA
eukprot:4936745-Pleurochrysis_carterae.AAC.1